MHFSLGNQNRDLKKVKRRKYKGKYYYLFSRPTFFRYSMNSSECKLDTSNTREDCKLSSRRTPRNLLLNNNYKRKGITKKRSICFPLLNIKYPTLTLIPSENKPARVTTVTSSSNTRESMNHTISSPKQANKITSTCFVQFNKKNHTLYIVPAAPKEFHINTPKTTSKVFSPHAPLNNNEFIIENYHHQTNNEIEVDFHPDNSSVDLPFLWNLDTTGSMFNVFNNNNNQ